MKVLDFPLNLSLNMFKLVLNKPSLSRLGLSKPSLNQVSACHAKTSLAKPGLTLNQVCFYEGSYGPYAETR